MNEERILFLKEALQLQEHPEGGFFREVYRSKEVLSKSALADRYGDARNVSTSIYFLLTSESFSAFHKIQQDETWHFYEGSTVHLHMISSDGNYEDVHVGASPEKGDVFQFTVPANFWFAAEVPEPDHYALVGCTVAPGFDFDDFTLGRRDELIKQFPSHARLIESFTRD